MCSMMLTLRPCPKESSRAVLLTPLHLALCCTNACVLPRNILTPGCYSQQLYLRGRHRRPPPLPPHP